MRSDTRSQDFAFDTLDGLAGFRSEELGTDSLTLPFSLSLWIRRHDVSLTVAVESLLCLRLALVRSAGLDERREPVPLLYPDDRTSILGLARYLADLLARAARASGVTRGEAAERAAALLLVS